MICAKCQEPTPNRYSLFCEKCEGSYFVCDECSNAFPMIELSDCAPEVWCVWCQKAAQEEREEVKQ